MTSDPDAGNPMSDVLLGEIIIRHTGNEDGFGVELITDNMSTAELLGLLEMAKIQVYDEVMSSQFLDDDEFLPDEDDPDDRQD